MELEELHDIHTDLFQQEVLDRIQWQLIKAIFQREKGTIVEFTLFAFLSWLVDEQGTLYVQGTFPSVVCILQSGITEGTPLGSDLL